MQSHALVGPTRSFGARGQMQLLVYRMSKRTSFAILKDGSSRSWSSQPRQFIRAQSVHLELARAYRARVRALRPPQEVPSWLDEGGAFLPSD